ncbi:hypothetical protein FIBSPDRAFT_897212 [Athelia psychrophila]|uniref:Uncharacterized protein n=1 Tax=Athelia psychrophila TaxID=1759441 RepID=A0A166CHG0_9AGAM|nr:hypothetical protein FIBSPDRAFT_897212 [Fibularhizoctonia sp. CBS 109695]
MAPSDLPALKSLTAEVLDKCPRFRILLAGKLYQDQLKVRNGKILLNPIHVQSQRSEQTVFRGLHEVCDINEPIIPPENSRVVLHKSQGFEPGETGNLKTVKDFILSRGDGVELKDRVHAVWLCVEIPLAGGRIFEIGDEEFLKLGLPGKFKFKSTL